MGELHRAIEVKIEVKIKVKTLKLAFLPSALHRYWQTGLLCRKGFL